MDAAAELGRNPVLRKHQIQPEYGDEQADAGDGTAEPVSRDQICRRERGQGKHSFPCLADQKHNFPCLPDHDQQPYPVDPYSYMYVWVVS